MLPQGPYNPAETEQKILKYWLDNNFYSSNKACEEDNRPTWSIICPPPNAYGRPHVGNISGYAYIDAMARYQRMQGKRVLVLPGKDHAGLEGEGVFVREVLEKQGKRKFDLTRDDFYAQMMDWMQENIKKVIQDEKAVGLSADFDKDIFTLDPRIVNQVLSTFVEMHQQGMIYKGVRIVNWDPKAKTAVADNQMERETVDGKFYYIHYPFSSSNNDTQISEFEVKDFSKVYSDVPISLGTIKLGNLLKLNPEVSSKADEVLVNQGLGGDAVRFSLLYVESPGDENYVVRSKTWKADVRVNLIKLAELTQGNLIRSVFISEDADKADISAFIDITAACGYKITKINSDFKDALNKYYQLIRIGMLVATTRPETMFGDTAVAVNPSDERHKHLIGKLVTIPLTNIQIPIISDWRVSKEEGTGCLKVTPAHSAEDYEIRLEWNKNNADKQIEIRSVIDKELKFLTNVPTQFAGRKYKECLPEIEAELQSSASLVNIESKQKNILISERTKAPIEPLLSSQWYLSYDVVTAQGKSLRQAALDMVNSGEIVIHPESQKQAFIYWVENLRDWAISRSLWWGYRLPVWYNGTVTEQIQGNGEVLEVLNEQVLDYSNPNQVKVQLESPGPGWVQDENVLDTWFSSGQWINTTLQALNLKADFFPTQVMLSGYDILQNWISRMVMFTYFKQGVAPFKDVYLTGLVQGPDGQKMSKSKGNLIDIDKVKEEYGTDALRMTYFYQNSAGASYALTYDKLKNFKQFMNKLWNASKYVLMHAQTYEVSITNEAEDSDVEFVNKLKTHMQQVKPQVKELIDSFEFGKATEAIYHSFWHDFCDVLIEESKPYLQSVIDQDTKQVLSSPDAKIAKQVSAAMLNNLVDYLKMLHPFAPFITEEIWQAIVNNPNQPLMQTI